MGRGVMGMGDLMGVFRLDPSSVTCSPPDLYDVSPVSQHVVSIEILTQRQR